MVIPLPSWEKPLATNCHQPSWSQLTELNLPLRGAPWLCQTHGDRPRTSCPSGRLGFDAQCHSWDQHRSGASMHDSIDVGAPCFIEGSTPKVTLDKTEQPVGGCQAGRASPVLQLCSRLGSTYMPCCGRAPRSRHALTKCSRGMCWRGFPRDCPHMEWATQQFKKPASRTHTP